MPESLSLLFLGAAGTVTGSRHLIRRGADALLLDCGLFQGSREERRRNWDPPPFDPQRLGAVVLSHAHIDHSGWLPVMARRGFRGPIYCTPGTADLLPVLLLDSAHLQQEEAASANRYGYTRHTPALPLYTAADAEAALKLVRPVPYGERFEPLKGITTILRRTAHILGSASIDLLISGAEPTRLVFSGDLGRWDRAILRDPELVPDADVLLVESTYGDRRHATDPSASLAQIVNEATRRGGALLIPAFTVGRVQELIWRLRRLEEEGRVPVLPVYIDSPMAINVADIYCRHSEDHNLEMTQLMDEKRCPLCCKQYHLVRTAEESKALNSIQGSLIIIAGNGMATGGRILHHMKLRLPDPRTTVVLPGFQAAGTRGRYLREGKRTLRIHGQDVKVRATVEALDGLSAHADQSDLLRWLSGFRRPPQQTFVVHGEPGPAAALVKVIRSQFGWPAQVAQQGEVVDLLVRKSPALAIGR